MAEDLSGACGVIGVRSIADLMQLHARAEQVDKAAAALSSDIVASATAAGISRVDLIPAGASITTLIGLRDHYRNLAEHGAASPASGSPSSGGFVSGQTGTAWSRLSGAQQEMGTRLGFKTEAQRESFAANVLKEIQRAA